LEKKWRVAEGNNRSVKFGGGFYCAEIDGYYVFNGFFMAMRDAFVTPGNMIYYFKVEWNPNELNWSDFRLRVLGKTDPSQADQFSIRGLIYTDWQKLGLSKQPETGSNGIHGSASAFEALFERINWCGGELKEDSFGKVMLDAGVTEDTIRLWMKDPQVVVDNNGNRGSIFDAFEDMDSGLCAKTAVGIQSFNCST